MATTSNQLAPFEMGTIAAAVYNQLTASQRPSRALVDPQGNPIGINARLQSALHELAFLHRYTRRRTIAEEDRGKYDAAQTITENERHWINADNLDPHSAASYTVRRKLRSRSRYEVVENNPYLKGTLLTICNDFTGGGPKLQIRDQRLSPQRKRLIERRFAQWMKVRKIRQKLWRMVMAKKVDGESYAVAYSTQRHNYPVRLGFQVIETDRFSTEAAGQFASSPNEIDGIRFDDNNEPLEYHLLNQHPGASLIPGSGLEGKWIDAKYVVHWFRQDRGWLRGIPETTPSLPLCALLRRYTLASVRAAEVAADFSAVLETEGPPSRLAWTDGQGNILEDDPFDVFPIERGMVTALPWGHKLKQLAAEHPSTLYDTFVGALLREITRPLLTPYNIAAGTSKDSNMATAVVDQHVYKGGIEAERLHCDEDVLDAMFALWWGEAILVSDYLDDPAFGESDFLLANPSLRYEPPEHIWRWDRVGLDHTDPNKVANALKTLHDKKFITDRDIQETYHNRDVEDWQEDVKDQEKFRNSLVPASTEEIEEPEED